MESDEEESSEFHFDLPFSDLSPFSAHKGSSKLKNAAPVQRQLQFDNKNRKLYFKSNVDSNDEDEGSLYIKNNNSYVYLFFFTFKLKI